MIERVSQHQSRFRAPGLSPDARGVALGPVGVVLLPSLERLVAFLRAAGEEGALDELLESLRIVQVISPLRTRELLVEVQSSSSHRMDRLAAIARLMSAMVFTGSSRHFVKYRDAQAPFGYDIAELIADPGDIALYHDRFAQPYRTDKVIPLRDLLMRLALIHVPRARAEAPRLLYATVRTGLGDAVVGYLARWSVGARVARVQWARGGTSDVIDEAWLLQLTHPAPRFVSLLRSLPGVTLFTPDGDRAAVEFGHRHPIPLSACAPLFGSEELVLFRAGGAAAIALPNRPPFVDVQSVTSLATSGPEPVVSARTLGVAGSFSLPLRLVPTGSAPRRVAAVVLPLKEQDTLGRVLSVLPPTMLARIQVAFTEHSIYLYGPDAASTIPLGLLFEEVGDGVMVPLGWGLNPPIPPEVLRQLANVGSDVRLFVVGGQRPITSIPVRAFEPATRVLLAELPVYEESVIAPPLDAEVPLPDLWPVPPGSLSGWFASTTQAELPPPRSVTPLLGAGDADEGSSG